jgi:hypothetical protein
MSKKAIKLISVSTVLQSHWLRWRCARGCAEQRPGTNLIKLFRQKIGLFYLQFWAIFTKKQHILIDKIILHTNHGFKVF